MWTVFRREFGQYFVSPVAYLIAAAYLLLTALAFNNDLTISLNFGRPADPSAVPQLLSFAIVFIAPLLTMRMLAEESREGTLELLMTTPVNDTAIVVGKFFAAWAFYSVLLLLSFISHQIILLSVTNLDIGHFYGAYLGMWLYGGAGLAVGLMFSSMTENQIVAAFLSMTFLLFMWLGDLAGDIVASVELANLIRKLTLQGHYSTSFAFGLFRAEDVVFFAGMITIALFVAIRVVESRRWR